MSDYYYELVVKVDAHRNLFVDFFNDITPVGYEERSDGFVLYSEEEPQPLCEGIKHFAGLLGKRLGKEVVVELSATKKHHSDWVERYQKSITPLVVGDFYIHPTWEKPKSCYRSIAIDPALAFGTGHHPTTASCLEAISSYLRPKMEVCDVGCGSGILAIAAAKSGAVVDACDTDRVSIENTRQNAKLNGVSLRALWQGSIDAQSGRYDFIVANIVADVLLLLHQKLDRALRASGALLVLSGILDKYESKVLARYSKYALQERLCKDEWVTLVLKKR